MPKGDGERDISIEGGGGMWRQMQTGNHHTLNEREREREREIYVYRYKKMYMHQYERNSHLSFMESIERCYITYTCFRYEGGILRFYIAVDAISMWMPHMFCIVSLCWFYIGDDNSAYPSRPPLSIEISISPFPFAI